MKKTLLFVSALCLGSSAFAQLDTIPNPSFDKWTGVSPNSWGGTNAVVGAPGGGAAASVFKATGADRADSLTGTTIGLKTTLTFGKKVPGTVLTGSMKFVNITTPPIISGGFPMRARPVALTGISKYKAVGGSTTDSSVIAIIFTKYYPKDTVNNIAAYRDTIGAGYLRTLDTLGFTPFYAPITFISDAVAPDSAQIILASSGSATIPGQADGNPGSTFFVDSLAFDYGCELSELITHDTIPHYYPDITATDTIRLNAGDHFSRTWTFYIPRNAQALGQSAILDSVRMTEEEVHISLKVSPTYTITSSWPTGMFGTNSISCVTVEFDVPATPANDTGSITLSPGLFGYSDAPGFAGVSLQSLAADSTKGFPLPGIPSTPIKIGKGVAGMGGIGIQNFSLGGGFNVAQNTPNPFDGSTTINFNAAGNGNIDFTVTDVLGRQVYDTNINATVGGNTFVFTTDLANGTYFFSLSDGKNTVTKKMVVTK
jgi:Secretion system C-terminal sorting domain